MVIQQLILIEHLIHITISIVLIILTYMIFLKLCKHGYSKVLDDACREIRYKRITRAQGLYLVRKYELNKLKT